MFLKDTVDCYISLMYFPSNWEMNQQFIKENIINDTWHHPSLANVWKKQDYICFYILPGEGIHSQFIHQCSKYGLLNVVTIIVQLTKHTSQQNRQEVKGTVYTSNLNQGYLETLCFVAHGLCLGRRQQQQELSLLLQG